MTRTGTICMALLMLFAMAGMLASVPRSGKADAGRRGRRPLQDGAKREELPTEPVVFHAGELRFVSCKASRERRLEDAEIYGARAGRMERQELASLLADQLLAAGAIAFTENEGVLRAQVKAVMPR